MTGRQRTRWLLQTRNFESVERDDDAAEEGELQDFRILGRKPGAGARPMQLQLLVGVGWVEKWEGGVVGGWGAGDSDGGRDRYSSAHEDM